MRGYLLTYMNDNIRLFEQALKIKNENPDINAPVNDVVECLKEIKSSNVSTKTSEKMVVGIFTSDVNKDYDNKQRNPNNNEIIVNNISNEYKELMANPI